MKLLFLVFRYIATRGPGLLCFAPQLVFILVLLTIFFDSEWWRLSCAVFSDHAPLLKIFLAALAYCSSGAYLEM